MKKKLFFIATTLYSNAQSVRCSIKSWWYAIIAFVVSCLMLITPISLSKYFASGESMLDQFPSATQMLYSFILDMDEENITCSVNNEKFTCDRELTQTEYVLTQTIDKKEVTYTIVLIDKEYEYDKVDAEVPQLNDNLIYFGEDKFFIRESSRTKDGKLDQTITMSGTYKHCGDFSFQTITDYIDIVRNQYKDSYSDKAQLEKVVEGAGLVKTQEVLSRFLYHISISDFTTILLLWLLLAIASCLLCVLSGAFIINYGNKKGNLADEYKIKGSIKIACNLLLMPALLSVIVGFIMPESVIITAPIIFYVRLFFIYRAQFTRKGQKLAIKTHKGLEEMID